MIIPSFIIDRIKQPAKFPEISQNSTPVIFFGDIENARVTTLSLNPSHNEFYKGENLLVNEKKRLETLLSLNTQSLETMGESQVQQVYKACQEYFNAPTGNPYKRWFNHIERLLQKSIGVSYYNGSCCHTDIIQWATNPKWNKLSNETKTAMLSNDLPFLKSLLTHYDINLVLLNGATTINEFQSHFSKEISNNTMFFPNTTNNKLKIVTGDLLLGKKKLKYFGWNRYIQRACKQEELNIISKQLLQFVKQNSILIQKNN